MGTASEYTLRQIQAALEKIDDLQAALKSVDTDELIARIVDSAGAEINPAKEDGNLASIKANTDNLTSDPATATKQDTMITALQLIDDLQAALASIAGDELRVEVTGQPITVQAAGGDKPLSLESVVLDETNTTNLSSGTAVREHTAVPAGKVWVITSLSFRYVGTPPTTVLVILRRAGVSYHLWGEPNPASGITYGRTGHWWLEAGDYIRFTIQGATAGDDFYSTVNGYQMDAP